MTSLSSYISESYNDIACFSVRPFKVIHFKYIVIVQRPFLYKLFWLLESPFFFSRSCPFIYESTWFCATVDDPFPITKYRSTHSEKIRRTKCYVKKCSFRLCRKKSLKVICIFQGRRFLRRAALMRSIDVVPPWSHMYVCRRAFNDWRKWIFKVIHGPHGQRSLRTDSVSAFGGVNRYRQ